MTSPEDVCRDLNEILPLVEDIHLPKEFLPSICLPASNCRLEFFLSPLIELIELGEL